MNSKMRVYELAKEMLTDSKVIVRIMEQMGLDAKNHMSTLDQPTAQKIREVLTGKSKIRLDAPRKPKAGAQASSATTPPRAVAPDRVEATRTAERSTPRRRPDRVSATRTVERQAVPQKPGQTASRATRRVAPRAEGASGTPSWGPGAYAGPRPYTPPPVPRRPRPVRRTEPVRTEDAAVKERSTDEDVLSAIRTIEEQPAVETPEAPEVAIPKETPDVSVLAEQAKEQPPAEEEVASSEAAPEPIQTQELSEQEPDETPVRDLPTRPVPQMPQRRQQPVRAATDTGRTRPREMPIPASEVAKMREREAASRPVMRTERSYPTRPQPGAPSRGPQRPGSQGPRGQVTIPAPPTTPGQADQSRQGGRGRQRGGGSRYSRGRDRRLNSEDGQRLSRLRKGYPIRRTDARRSTAPPKEVIIDGPVTVKELASKMAMSVGDLIKRLMDAGIMATINHELDVDTAQIMGEEIGIPVRFKPPELSAEEKMEARAQEEDSPEDLLPRPPVVTVMGHVDHGKTSLLDAIRETNVAAGEAGGITQHIGASVAEIDGRKIVFLDTPGHEAFTAMRARGAEATDVAVLVVAADDGVMPQTKEAISHARSAGVPLVVALNKTDIPTANPDLVKRQLLEEGVVPEEWGGQTIIVPVSAKLREGIETLLEMILLTAEMEELKGNPNRLARGFVIEAQIDRGRGPVATVLVQNGTLEVGHAFVSGATYGRVRALMDDRGRRVKSAGPSIPVEVIGLTDLPQAGDVFQVVEDERVAREIALSRSTRRRSTELEATRRATLEDLYVLSKEGEVRDLNILVKADVQGTLEAMRNAMEGMRNEEVRVSIVHQGVGGINESDVMLASASNATVLGFNVRPTVGARKLAETDGVDLRMYRVIYDAVDDIKAALTGMLKPKMHEVVYGRAEVRATFRVPRVGTVAGCYVTDGKAMRSANVRVVRDGIVVHEGKLATLRRFKDDVREVQEGFECGIGLERYQDLKEGDVFEFFGEEEVKAG